MYFEVCACSDFHCEELLKKAPTQFLEDLRTSIDFSKPCGYNGLGNAMYKITGELPSDLGVAEVELCLEFLREKSTHNAQSTHESQEGRYIALWSFIYEYFGIEQNSTYDYLLMNYLEHMGYIEHGTGIRCGWINSECTRTSTIKHQTQTLLSIKAWICDNELSTDRPWLKLRVRCG